MKYFKTIFITLALILTPTVIFGEETTVADVLGDQEIDSELISALDEKEEEREEDFENQLLLSIPEQTDNPSHILTFTDPSEEKDGVQLEIDGEKYIEISSPYSLPALNIGAHTLKFKFTDEEGAAQLLEKELIVLPRPPILNAPQMMETDIDITGNTLANSEVIILITQDTISEVVTVESKSDGTFSYSYTPESETESVFNISAYTRKYGYASNLSELKTVSRNSTSDNTVDDNDKVVFSVAALADPVQVWKDSPELVGFSALVFVLGILIGVILVNMFSKNREGKKIKKLEREISSKSEKKELTLREKLALENTPKEKKATETKKDAKKKDKVKKKVEKKESKPQKKDEVKEKVVTKETFMKDFKSFDPDNKKGKERKVKVSLTSKSE